MQPAVIAAAAVPHACRLPQPVHPLQVKAAPWDGWSPVEAPSAPLAFLLHFYMRVCNSICAVQGQPGMHSAGQCQTAMLVCIMRHKAVRRERELCMGMGRQVGGR